MSSDAHISHLRLVTPPHNLTKVPLLNLKSYSEIGDDLLLVALQPADEHGDQDVEDHRRSSG